MTSFDDLNNNFRDFYGKFFRQKKESNVQYIR